MEEENNVINNQNEQEPQGKAGMSIASMVLGIVGLIVAALPCGILAIIFSIIGRKKGGKGFATAGLVLGIIDAAFGLFAVITAVATVSSILG